MTAENSIGNWWTPSGNIVVFLRFRPCLLEVCMGPHFFGPSRSRMGPAHSFMGRACCHSGKIKLSPARSGRARPVFSLGWAWPCPAGWRWAWPGLSSAYRVRYFEYCTISLWGVVLEESVENAWNWNSSEQFECNLHTCKILQILERLWKAMSFNIDLSKLSTGGCTMHPFP